VISAGFFAFLRSAIHWQHFKHASHCSMELGTGLRRCDGAEGNGEKDAALIR